MAAPPSLDLLPLAVAVERFLLGLDLAVAGGSLSPNTRDNYARDLAEFVELLTARLGEHVRLDDVTAEDVDLAVLAYGRKPDARFTRSGDGTKTRGPGAQARFRQSVSRLFRDAELRGWVRVSPMPRTQVRPRVKGLSAAHRKALSEQSAAALLETAATRDPARERRPLRRRDEFLLRLLIEAGPRVSEVCAADRADLQHRDDGTTWLHIRHGKGGRQRWVPLSAGTVAAYEDYVAHERPGPRPRPADTTGRTVEDAERALVLSWRGRRMTPRDVQLLLERTTGRVAPDQRRRVTPHGLRHTAATLLLSSGAADIHTVKELLGHASIATTGVYLDVVDQQMAQAVAAHPVTGDRPAAGRRRP